MQTNLEKLNYLFEKYEKNTEGLFHTLLWRLLINELRKNVRSAFVFIHGMPQDKVNVGIADLDVSGYTPALFSIKSTVSDKEREAMINELNSVVFNLTPDMAFVIVLSTYKG